MDENSVFFLPQLPSFAIFVIKPVFMSLKILHTADWHLGQTFYGYERYAEHTVFLDWLCHELSARQADVLLIAGDVFDSPNPSAASQQMFYRFLRRATEENPSLQVVVIAGNHDSAARLEAPDPLFKDMHVDVRGLVRRTSDGDIDLDRLVVPLGQAGCPEAYCLAVPYLRQGDYPPAENYAQGVASLYRALYEKVSGLGKPVVAMGHLQATGAEVSENDRSERTIIGGLECVSPEAFAASICYTALGHLHRAQRVSGRDNVRYAGAPIPMSFAEKNNRHGVVCVTVDGPSTAIEMLPFEPPVSLVSVSGAADDIEAAIDRLPAGEADAWSPYLEVKVALSRPEPSLRQRIESALVGKRVRLARLVPDLPRREGDVASVSFVEEGRQAAPLEIANDYYKKMFNTEMPADMTALFQEIMREVNT